MKFDSNILASIAYRQLAALIDDELGNVEVDERDVEKAQLCLHIMRAVAQKKRRLQIDVSYQK